MQSNEQVFSWASDSKAVGSKLSLTTMYTSTMLCSMMIINFNAHREWGAEGGGDGFVVNEGSARLSARVENGLGP